MARQAPPPPSSSTRELKGALRSPLDRLLTIFSDIRPGEGPVGIAMLGSVFLLLTSLYFLKPARDGLLAISGSRPVSPARKLIIGVTFYRTKNLLPGIITHGVFDAVQIFVIIPIVFRMMGMG